jgi:hypothetical protein
VLCDILFNIPLCLRRPRPTQGCSAEKEEEEAEEEEEDSFVFTWPSFFAVLFWRIENFFFYFLKPIMKLEVQKICEFVTIIHSETNAVPYLLVQRCPVRLLCYVNYKLLAFRRL